MRSLLLVCASAALYAASFPPLALGVLAWVALVPLFHAIVSVRPRHAALLGATWGLGIAIGVGLWFPGMLASYFEQPPIVGWAGFLAVGLGLSGVYYAAFGAWLSWVGRRGAVAPLVVAAGWGACEFARARLFVGNPWVLAGYSQVHFAPLVQIADATGPYGPGMLVAAVNAVIAGVFAARLRGPRPLRSVAGVVAVLAFALVYGEWRLAQHFGDGEAVHVAVVQGAIERGFRWRPEYRDVSLGRYRELTERAAAASPDLVLWPENAVDFYLQEDSPERRAVLDEARELGVDLVLGGPHYSFEAAQTRYHISVFLVREGRIAARYDKLHLLPLAEENLPGALWQRKTAYTPGRAPALLDTDVGRLGAFVCFEAMYPELVRRFALAGADVLANLSNDAWFGAEAPARHHLDIASFRAIENRRYLVRAASTGFSAVIDPWGRMMEVSRFGTPEVLTAPVRRSAHSTPYQRWGDAAAWLAVAAALGQMTKRRNQRRET